MSNSSLAGLSVLVVEDEMLVSLLIEDALTEAHCKIVGPFDRVPAALLAARIETIHAAVLDVNVAGSEVYPVAELLAARRIPFLFVSGYGKRAIPNNRFGWRVQSKPFKTDELLDALTEIVSDNERRPI